MQAVGAIHAAEIEAQLRAGKDDARRGRGLTREPQVADEQVAGASGDEAERDVAADEAGRGLHRGAVAAVADHDVEPLRACRGGEAPSVTWRRGGEHFDVPAAAAQRLADRGDGTRIGSRGGGIGDEQGAGQGQNRFSQKRSRPICRSEEPGTAVVPQMRTGSKLASVRHSELIRNCRLAPRVLATSTP